MKRIMLTSKECTTDRSSDDLKSKESTHAMQHWAVLVINAMNPDGVNHWEDYESRQEFVEVKSRTRTRSQEDGSAYWLEEKESLTRLKRVKFTLWPGEIEFTDLDQAESKKATPLRWPSKMTEH